MVERPAQADRGRPCRQAVRRSAQGQPTLTSVGRGGPGRLEAEVAQAGVIGGSRTRSIPVEEPVWAVDRDVVDAGVPLPHQAMLVELPVLVPVRSEPLAVDVA